MPGSRSPEVIFTEVQQFRQVWLWAMVLAWPASMAIILGYVLFRQLLLASPAGHLTWNSIALIAAFAVPLLVTLIFAWLLYATRLITEVRGDGLYVRFWPLGWRHIRFDEITECWPRTYRPIREFGGWGIRWGRGGKAYNISGNRGVQLVLAGGRRLLIGSQHAEELAAAIRDALICSTYKESE
ncbi:MAG TPA: DUF6141 family protein [Phycisphaerae bacterium]|nr:DUF6141 family protein [Phycisphaerae bacterium]HRR85682.1 DUF6141 family protein [Phycisphaerae bacterium]